MALGQLEISQRLAKHFARHGAAQRFFHGAPCETEGCGGDRGAKDVECSHRHFETLAWRAQHLRIRDAAIFKAQASERVGSDDFNALGNFESGRGGIDDERGDRAGARRFTGPCEQNVEVGDAAVGDPGLFAVQDVRVTIAARFALQGGDVGARVEFGKSECGDGGAFNDPRQILLFMKGRSEKRDSAGAEALHGKGKISKTGMPGKNFANETNGAGVDGVRGGAISDAANGVLQPAAFAELPDQRAACGVDVRGVFAAQMNAGPTL